MASPLSMDSSAAEPPAMRWRFPFFAFSAGILSLWVGGFLGGALAFGIAAALARKTGRSRALLWALMIAAVLCAAGLVVMVSDIGFGRSTLNSSSG